MVHSIHSTTTTFFSYSFGSFLFLLDVGVKWPDVVDLVEGIVVERSPAVGVEIVVGDDAESLTRDVDVVRFGHLCGRDEQRVGRTECGAGIPINLGEREAHETTTQVVTNLLYLPRHAHGVGLVAIGGGLVGQIVGLAHDALEFCNVVGHNDQILGGLSDSPVIQRKIKKRTKSDLHVMCHFVEHDFVGGTRVAVETIFAEEVEFALELFVGCDARVFELA